MEAAACARPATGYTYARREPEKSPLYKTLQEHLLTFEQEWTDKSDGRTLPSFVTRRCATLGPTRPAPAPRALRARPSPPSNGVSEDAHHLPKQLSVEREREAQRERHGQHKLSDGDVGQDVIHQGQGARAHPPAEATWAHRTCLAGKRAP